jgi:hypothetical protein
MRDERVADAVRIQRQPVTQLGGDDLAQIVAANRKGLHDAVVLHPAEIVVTAPGRRAGHKRDHQIESDVEQDQRGGKDRFWPHRVVMLQLVAVVVQVTERTRRRERQLAAFREERQFLAEVACDLLLARGRDDFRGNVLSQPLTLRIERTVWRSLQHAGIQVRPAEVLADPPVKHYFDGVVEQNERQPQARHLAVNNRFASSSWTTVRRNRSMALLSGKCLVGGLGIYSLFAALWWPRQACDVRPGDSEMRALTRLEMYELAWSEPMQSLAKKFSLSDRGLAKICAAANIPVPARGYWAKLQAGKKVERWPLPARALGQCESIWIGRSAWGDDRESDADILNSAIPPEPVFTPDMDDVCAHAASLVRKAPLPLGDTHGWHSQVAKCLAADDERARKQKESPYPSSWNDPIFASPFEKRRLRILNALFICLTCCGMHPHLSGQHGRDLSVTVGDTTVPLLVDGVAAAKQAEREFHGDPFRPRSDKDAMQLSFRCGWSGAPSGSSWQDKPGAPLERQLREVAAAVIVFAEETLRAAVAGAHTWRIKRQAELQEAERKRKLEEERQRSIRQARRERARVDHLLGQARAFEQARQIRTYVDAVRCANDAAPDPMSAEELEAWSAWALEQASLIDPVLSSAYKTRPVEPEE